LDKAHCEVRRCGTSVHRRWRT